MNISNKLRGLGSLTVPTVLFVVLLLVAVIQAPRLYSVSGIANAILVSAPLILATLSLTPIVMAGRGAVDLSVGPLIGFLNVTLIAWLSGNGITNPILFCLWALVAGAAYQGIQALIVIYVRISPIIVALSGYLILTGVNLMVMSRPGGVAPDWMYSWAGGGEPQIFSPILWLVIAALCLWGLVTRTGFHRQLRLVGADERMAYTAGVRVDLIRFLAYALGGVFAGFAALSYTALISSGDPTQGSTYTLQAVTALVLGGASLAGGRGGATGAVLGALNMFLISYLLGSFNFGSLSGFITSLAYGAILAISLLINVFATQPNSKA
ncbi:ABC transporter permease [Mameliella alba]|uniref:ABC transporter permease n=1 Tax=Mameliella alba TaxID=561184 RepID=UPI001C973A73|nr:ABC transporter permease [Mameliella alba]MBY6122808.1 ABC transporter permease [Mameliella alba]